VQFFICCFSAYALNGLTLLVLVISGCFKNSIPLVLKGSVPVKVESQNRVALANPDLAEIAVK